MSSPSTPVKLCLPVRPKRIALGECLCGGITSFGELSRYAVYIVVTVARRGARPGLTRISERRSDSTVVTSFAALTSVGSITSLYDQRNGTARGAAPMRRFTSSCPPELTAQNGNMCLRSISSCSASRAAVRSAVGRTVLMMISGAGRLFYGRRRVAFSTLSIRLLTIVWHRRLNNPTLQGGTHEHPYTNDRRHGRRRRSDGHA